MSVPAADRPQVGIHGRLSPREAQEVLDLVAAATAADGVAPLSEHVMLHLRYGGELRARNLLIFDGGALAGYAHLDPTDPVEGPSGELVVHPRSRGRGLGLALTRALAREAGDRPLRLWAHGDLPAAQRLAAVAGFQRARALWQMRRPLDGRLAEPELPPGIRLRTFAPGQDEEAWAELNRRAFAGHPEQGAWTRADMEMREREPWFDPAGFFIAERDHKMAGFHWTKIHGQRGEPRPGAGHGHEPIGEVYVVGVDPAEQGTGLGRALTLAGLHHLQSKGISQVMLYVDETNTPAIRLYQSLGFTHWGTDVMFARQPGSQPGAES
jgi:mycothiol synthase